MTLQADVELTQDGAGWTERYYLAPESRDLHAVADRLANARAGILASPAYLEQIRVIDLDHPRLPTVVRYHFIGQFTAVGFETLGSDDRIVAGWSWTCALMRFDTEFGRGRTFHFNGIPSMDLRKGSPFKPFLLFAQLLFRLRRLRDELSQPNLNLQIEELLPDNAVASSPIDAIDTSGSGLYRVHTRTDFAVDETTQVRVMGSRGNNLGRVRGIRHVTRSESPRSFVLDRGPIPERGPIRYTGGAVLRPAIYQYSPAIWQKYGKMTLTDVPNKGIFFLPTQLRETNPLLGEFGIGVRVRGGVRAKKRGRRHAR